MSREDEMRGRGGGVLWPGFECVLMAVPPDVDGGGWLSRAGEKRAGGEADGGSIGTGSGLVRGRLAVPEGIDK